jgi:hypothetical protein
VELLVDELEKGQRKAFEQVLAQSLLKLLRQLALDLHDSFLALKPFAVANHLCLSEVTRCRLRANTQLGVKLPQLCA